jgi:hypothetical protein
MGHQSLVVLSAVGSKIRGVCAMVTDMAELDAAGREASASLLVADTLIPIMAEVDEWDFFKAHIWPDEPFLLALAR